MSKQVFFKEFSLAKVQQLSFIWPIDKTLFDRFFWLYDTSTIIAYYCQNRFYTYKHFRY